MDDQPQLHTEKPPEHLAVLNEVLKGGADPDLLLAGIRRAKEEGAQHAVLQMAQGVIPSTLLGVLSRLDELEKMAAAFRKARAARPPCGPVDATPEPAPGEPSVT